MTWGAIIAGGVALAGSVISSEAADSAAKKQAKGGTASLAELTRQFNQNRQDLAPYRQRGGQALDVLSQQLGLGSGAGPLSYEQWRTQRTAAGGTASAPKSDPNGMRDIVSATDPLGLYSGGERSVERALDPIGIFGSKKKKKPKPAQVAAQAAATEANERALYDSYLSDYNASHADNTGIDGDLLRDFTAEDFQKDPGYDFRIGEGAKAVEGSAAARGGLLSGAAAKRMERYGQDFASNEYSNVYNRFNNDRNQRFNRLAALAGVGQTATNTAVASGTASSNNIADTMIGNANASAAARVAQGNNINSGLNTLGNFYLQRQYGWNPQQQVTSPTASSPKSAPSGFVGPR